MPKLRTICTLPGLDAIGFRYAMEAAAAGRKHIRRAVRHPPEVASRSDQDLALKHCGVSRNKGHVAMKRTPSDEYLEQAGLLGRDAAERVLSRMRSRLMRRLEDKKMSTLEAIAIQLEIEAEELHEWREKMAEIRRKTKAD